MTKFVYLLQVLGEMYLSVLQKLESCFAQVEKKHQAHLTEVVALKEIYKMEVEEVKIKSYFLLSFQKHFSLKRSDMYIFFVL